MLRGNAANCFFIFSTFIILAIHACAVIRTENIGLKAPTVFLQTFWFPASAAPCLLTQMWIICLFSLRTLHCTWPAPSFWHKGRSSTFQYSIDCILSCSCILMTTIVRTVWQLQSLQYLPVAKQPQYSFRHFEFLHLQFFILAGVLSFDPDNVSVHRFCEFSILKRTKIIHQ